MSSRDNVGPNPRGPTRPNALSSSPTSPSSSAGPSAASSTGNTRGQYSRVPLDATSSSSSSRYGTQAETDSLTNSNDSTESQQQARTLMGGQQIVTTDSSSSQSDLGPYSHIRKGSIGQMGQRSRGGKYGGASRPLIATAATSSSGLSSGQVPSTQSSQFLQVAQSDSNRWSYNSNLSDAPNAKSRLSVPSHDEMYLDKGIAEPDDYLHNSDGKKDKAGFHLWSTRGVANFVALLILFCGLMALFAGYPIIAALTLHRDTDKGGFNLGGTNGTGQVPVMENMFHLVDPETPSEAQTWTNPIDNNNFHIVFSDEFNQEGRTFWPGDDPFWEAVDIWYGVTGDKQWYSPEAVNTTNGFLQLTMIEKVNHDLYFQSGMLQSWNKFCFQGGYIEFSAILPGSPDTEGWWPGLWTLGNLGRAGYPGTTEGMWPYSYDSCDTGILKNQTNLEGTGPAEVLNAQGPYSAGVDNKLSYLPGMRYPACTCPGEDHPGPNHNVGRAAPELDILEAQTRGGAGEASQSVQTAPFDVDYAWRNTTADATIYDSSTTHFNSYTGGVYQEAVSGVTVIPADAYELAPRPRAVTFGAHYTPDWTGTGDGRVDWFIDGKPAWSVQGSAMRPDSRIDIGQRLVPVEPMYLIMNFGMSDGFQTIRYSTLDFPATFKIDYVRVYQQDGQEDRISCDPPDHPTSHYINTHPEIYYNPNHTVYPVDLYGGAWPKNSLTGC